MGIIQSLLHFHNNGRISSQRAGKVKKYDSALLDDFRDRDSGRVFENMEFHNCRFQSGFVSNTHWPKKRSVVRRVLLQDCEVIGCTIGPAVFQEVVVENLEISELLQVWGAVFEHVVMRGKIGRIMISHHLLGGMAAPAEQESFDCANERFYRSVDWTLDISEGVFAEFEVHGVPARSIRRNPEHQFLVRKENLLDGRWKEFGLKGTVWYLALLDIVNEPYPDGVLVVPLANNRWKLDIQLLQPLKEAGILE